MSFRICKLTIVHPDPDLMLELKPRDKRSALGFEGSRLERVDLRPETRKG